MTSEGTVCTGCGDPAVLLDRVPVGLTVAALCADCLMTYLGEVRDQLANMGVEVRHLREQAKETETLREALTAAEAAREAVAGEVREAVLMWAYDNPAGFSIGLFPGLPVRRTETLDQFKARGATALPTPSAALQRVREEAVRQAVARADTTALESRWAALVRAMPYYSTEQGFADALRTVLLNTLLPTLDPAQVFP